MPSTTLKTIPLTEWYCQECTINLGHEPGLIKEEHTCSICGETKLCTHAMRIEKSYNSRARLITGQIRQATTTERNNRERACPECGAIITHLNYGASGCYERGTYYFTDGGYHEADETDNDGASFEYTCPECDHIGDIEDFGPVEETANEDAETHTKGGENI